jgi:BRCA1/BRCA2-containing complex subunit 3
MLQHVFITDDCYNTCVSHALTSEKEEIMGLLLGNIEELQDQYLHAYVWDVCMLTRIDKRKDRVEISPDQLVHATSLAEKITEKERIRTRVIGWYHSHPHFNPYPSHVDLRCQGNYQQLEKGFVGLIFSVFNTNKEQHSTIQLHAFQSIPSNSSNTTTLDVQNKNNVVASPYSSDDEVEMLGYLTPVRSTPFESYNVPVSIISSSQVNYDGKSLERIISLQQIMLQEEKNGFEQAQEKLVNVTGQAATLNRISNLSLYQRNLTKIIDHCSVPIILFLQEELEYNKAALEALETEEQQLLQQIQQ